MTIKLVIFDFDGTLADSFGWFSRVLNGVADRYAFRRVEPHEVEALRGLSAREMVKHLGVPAWKLPLIARHMRRLKAREPAALFEGTSAMLRTLSARGTALAVVSSDSEDNVRRTLGPALAGLIAHYACGASLFGKAAKFRSVLRHARLSPSDTIAIGDELRDLEAARGAGIAFGAVTWGYTRPDALAAHAPEEMFNSIGEICDKLTGTTA